MTVEIIKGVEGVYAFPHVYHPNDTSSPFAARFRDESRALRTDITSCDFRLALKNDPTTILIDWGECDGTSGAASWEYAPSTDDMDISVTYGEPFWIAGQYRLRITGGGVEYSPLVYARLEANVDSGGGAVVSRPTGSLVSFTDADLVAGIYTIVHSLNKAVVTVEIWNEDGQEIDVKQEPFIDNNTVAVDLAVEQAAGGGAISGTWTRRVY